MNQLIDFHSHFFSRAFFEALAEQSPHEGTVDRRVERVGKSLDLELPSRDHGEHLERWLAELDTYGVAHLVSFASLPQEAGVVGEAAKASNGRITPFALVNPLAPEAPAGAAELFAQGFRGVLLFPAMHRFDPSGPEARAVYEQAAEQGAIVVVHCGMLQVKLRDLFGLPRPYDLSTANPLALIPAANDFGQVRFVIPHFGAGFLRETLMLASMCENVYVDTSSSNGWVATQAAKTSLVDVFERALGVLGPERVLFGTDSSTFPRGWRHDLYMAQREALGAIGAPEEDRVRIFGGNARGLLGLD
ncbi:MAG: amidohydrolase family protein [Planctomycetota bacterium]